MGDIIKWNKVLHRLKQSTGIRKTSDGAIKITKEDGSFIEGHSIVAVLLYEVLNELKIMNSKTSP